MSLIVRCFFSLFLLLSPAFIFAQTDNESSSNTVGDLNKDGVSDSKDKAILLLLLNRNREVEFEPEIRSFTAHPSRVNFGQSSTLRWNVTGNPTSVSIDHGIGDVTNLKSIVVKPQVTTTYTLTVENSESSVTKEVTVHVKPKIVSFTSSPRIITSGEENTLEWSIEGEPTEVSIDQGVGVVTGTSVKVSPDKTTTYTITAVSSGGSVSRRVTVRVKPKIISFTANSALVAPESEVTLSWEINGEPTEVSINQGVGDVTGLTKVSVFPSTTTVYTIRAANQHGSTTQTVRVNVKDLPVVTSFTASNMVIRSGESVLLGWRVTGGETISLSKTVGSITTQENIIGTSKRVYPRETTTYTLTAENSSGSVTATITIYFLSIASFTADPSVIAEGNSSELEWEITGEPTEVAINQGVGDVTGLTSTSVSPDVTTTYTLTATKSHEGRSRTVTDRVRVTVDDVPVIESFTASNAVITTGESTLLSWDVTGSSPLQVSLSKTVGSSTTSVLSSLPGNSSSRQSPVVTTTYTLTAENEVGTATAEITVYFLNVTSFEASPSTITAGGTSELRWGIDGEPTEITIDQNVGNVTGLTNNSVSPQTTTTYTLTAVKTVGSQERTVTAQTTLNVQTRPVIESFTANNRVLVSDDNTLLEWNVLGSDPVSISLSKTEGTTTTALLSSVPKSSSYTQSPTQTTTYTLRARNSLGTVTATVTVYYLNISSFTATPSSIAPGVSSVLEWDVDGEPTSLSIDQGVGSVKGLTTTSVSPQADTTYTLTATKTVGSETETVTKTTTVDVVPLPEITSFTVDVPFVVCDTGCAGATLNWTVMGADSLAIDQNVGDVFGSISTYVTPDESTTYTLTATNSSGSVTKSVTLDAFKIIEFTASPSSITSGSYSVLEWDVDGNPDSISIDQDIGDVTGVSSTIVTPSTTTTYELTATKEDTANSVTETLTSTVTVTVTTSMNMAPGQSIQDCPECPKLLSIPSTLLGQGFESPNEFSAVGIKKITGAEWQACVQDNMCTNYNFSDDQLNRSMNNINFVDVSLYLDWLYQKTGKTYHLLGDQEWNSIVDQIRSGNLRENAGFQNFVIDESRLDSSLTGVILDSGFRVVRDIDSVDQN
ncbi:MAG: hypothetical protein OXK80_03890 [Bdellovibrionales bacterium]|nr:hypothetical protein [Bdellovibrionales bacterium]